LKRKKEVFANDKREKQKSKHDESEQKHINIFNQIYKNIES